MTSAKIRLCPLFVVLRHQSKGLFKRIKHVGQTLPNILRWCWTVFDRCWLLECSNESNIIKQCWISVPGTKLWRIFNHANENGGRCWMKSLNKVKLHPTLSNIVQHYPTCLIVLFKRVKHVASNNV